MVIAMLSLPSGCSGSFSRSLGGMMCLSCVFSAFFSVSGLAAGWAFNLPVGAMTVIIAGIVFLLISVFRAIRK
jgi:zinc transport system permease protein